MRSWFSLSRSDNDEAIQILAQAIWIASLTLAMTPSSRHHRAQPFEERICSRDNALIPLDSSDTIPVLATVSATPCTNARQPAGRVVNPVECRSVDMQREPRSIMRCDAHTTERLAALIDEHVSPLIPSACCCRCKWRAAPAIRGSPAMVSAAGVERHPWMPRARRFRRFHVKIYDHGRLPASHHDRLANLVWTSVDLLVRHVRRYVNKISRPGFFAQFQMIAPSHSHPTLHHVQHCL
jgi:hypothetical protein